MQKKKYLINVCAHDGILSHYAGVGTSCGNHVKALLKIAKVNPAIDFTINLITPEYLPNSFGYSADRKRSSEHAVRRLGGRIYQVSNGTAGKLAYGEPEVWDTLCRNTAELINGMDISTYHKVINLYNDGPFAQVAQHTRPDDAFLHVWIPRSTVAIHNVDSSLPEGTAKAYKAIRFEWERSATAHINASANAYLGAIGNFMRTHMIDVYGARPNKCRNIWNGVLLDEPISTAEHSEEMQQYMDEIDISKTMILSYGRAEEYKNLEFTLQLAKLFDPKHFTAVVIAQSYYAGQPILQRYKNMAEQSKHPAKLFIDPPLGLAKALLELNMTRVVIVPSRAEPMGLIINEVRRRNDPNNLVVANAIQGLAGQIEDGIDGLLIDASEGGMAASHRKITSSLDYDTRVRLAGRGYDTVQKHYNITANMTAFLSELTNESLKTPIA